MKEEVNALFAVLSSAVCEREIPEEYRLAFGDDMFLDRVTKLASFHDLAHLLYYSLLKEKIITKESCEKYKTAENHIKLAKLLYEQLDAISNKVYALFEENEIPYIPLKGAVLRKLYPEPWMRKSVDTDIFIKECDIDKAINLLSREMGGKTIWTGDHDIPVYFDNNTHIELHFSFSGLPMGSDRIMENIFSVSQLSEGKRFGYSMPYDRFYYYHIAHMAKHIKSGGCGIKPFIDLYLMDQKNTEFAKDTLRKGGLLDFSENASNLADIWMSGKMPSGKLLSLAKYILRGGSFGNYKTRAEQNTDNGILTASGRIFLPYDKLKYYYKELEKHKWLYPFCIVKRLARLTFKTLPAHIKSNRVKPDVKMQETTREMMKQIGL